MWTFLFSARVSSTYLSQRFFLIRRGEPLKGSAFYTPIEIDTGRDPWWRHLERCFPRNGRPFWRSSLKGKKRPTLKMNDLLDFCPHGRPENVGGHDFLSAAHFGFFFDPPLQIKFYRPSNVSRSEEIATISTRVRYCTETIAAWLLETNSRPVDWNSDLYRTRCSGMIFVKTFSKVEGEIFYDRRGGEERKVGVTPPSGKMSFSFRCRLAAKLPFAVYTIKHWPAHMKTTWFVARSFNNMSRPNL